MDFAQLEHNFSSAQGAALFALARVDGALTGRQLAGVVPTHSHRSLAYALEDLVAAGLVDMRPAGRANLYALNREHLASGAIEHLANLRDAVLTRMTDLVRSWMEPPAAAWLFGSFARGTAAVSSDIDVLLVRRKASSLWEEQVAEFSATVTRWTGNDCRVLEYDDAELRALVEAGDPLIVELKRDAIVLTGERPSRLLAKR